VPSLLELVRSHTDLDEADVGVLQLLMADWQIIADLSFADLVLWLPDRGGEGFWAAGQMRPTTGPTAYVDDVVGTFVPAGRRPMLDQAYADARLVREGDPEWRDDVPVRVETIPVPRRGRVIAVIARNTNLLGVRTPSRLELSYLQSAADLTAMIASGDFPPPGQRGDHADSPRVGDGFVRVDERGRVTYASPNALSVYRRLGWSGDLDGRLLPEVTRELVPPRRRPDEETLSAVLGGRAHLDTEIGDDEVSLIVRAIPLRSRGEHVGALVLVRDVSDLRRRDRELVTKDATIREIHHRVKNNLQTVAALLRLQARRIESPDAKAALEEAVRRVGSIAIVHETLSQEVHDEVGFDEIADRLGAMVTDVGARPDDRPDRVVVRREGSFGLLGNETATALAMVLTELLQNAVEHGYPEDAACGTITVESERIAGRLRVTVDDDGVGLPPGFDPDTSLNLGLSIVRTLVESELGGLLELRPGPERGSRAVVDVPLDGR
jgi:two-component sensor histidine kinase